MLSLFLIFLIGPLVGILSAVMGVGGGILIIPALYFLYPSMSAESVLATSLFTICLSTARNSYLFLKSGKTVDKREMKFLMPFMVCGTLIGVGLAGIFSPVELKRFFALSLALLVVKLLIYRRPKRGDHSPVSSFDTTYILKLIAIPMIAGPFSGLTGLGGGSVLVPLFLEVLKLPFKSVSVYSNLLMSVGTFTGALFMAMKDLDPAHSGSFLGHFQIGRVNIALALILFIGSALSAPLGIHLNKNIPEYLYKALYAVLLITISLKVFTSTLTT